MPSSLAGGADAPNQPLAHDADPDDDMAVMMVRDGSSISVTNGDVVVYWPAQQSSPRKAGQQAWRTQ
jgi:hypothetical protein